MELKKNGDGGNGDLSGVITGEIRPMNERGVEREWGLPGETCETRRLIREARLYLRC